MVSVACGKSCEGKASVEEFDQDGDSFGDLDGAAMEVGDELSLGGDWPDGESDPKKAKIDK